MFGLFELLVVALVVLWLLGFVGFHVLGGLIHILIVVAVIILLYRLLTGAYTRSRRDDVY